MPPRIGLIHALLESLTPIETAFGEVWPEVELIHLYDGSLYADYQRSGRITPDITRRITDLIRYSGSTGAAGVLVTGSLFGESVAAARKHVAFPLLSAYEALIEAAFAAGSRLGLLATVPDTVRLVQRDVACYAESHGIAYTWQADCVAGAFEALKSGDRQCHDQLIAQAAAAMDCDALMLAQHSMGAAREQIAPVRGRVILTSPESAAIKLRKLVGEAAGSNQ